MKKLTNLLKTRVMAYDLNSFYFISLAICFVHSFLFIAFLEPFDYFRLNEYPTYYYALGYATLNFINEFIMIALFSKVFVKFSENWVFWKDSMFWLIMLATVTISQLVAIHYTDNIAITFANFFKMLGVIIVVGIIPFFVFVITKFVISRKNHIKKFDMINKSLKYKLKVYSYNNKSSDTEFHLVGMNKNDVFKFKEKDFFYASSDENYVHIYFEFNHKMEKLTFRISLISFIRQLSSNENIVQCHKSYVVNKSKIVNIGGSSRGYKLYLKNMENPIPIGLKFYEEIANKITLAKN